MITFGHEEFIEKAINGVLEQVCSFKFELIIANDCSPDGTEFIVNSIINHHPNSRFIRYTKHSDNIGMQKNFLWAYHQAKGKYIALCEGDDYWTDQHKLQKQFDFLESKPEYSLCFHPAKILMNNGKLVNEFEITVPSKFHQLIDMARFGNYIRTPTVMFRNILTDQDLNLLKKCPAGDFPLNLILGQYGNYGFIADTMAVYRHGVGIWSTLSTKQSTFGFIITIIHSKDYFLNKGGFEEIVKALNNGLSFFISSIYNELNSKDFEPFLKDELILREFLISIIDNKLEIKRPIYPRNFVHEIKKIVKLLIRRVNQSKE
jgi:glycosyltransferase involved in cell wall biosynthesis